MKTVVEIIWSVLQTQVLTPVLVVVPPSGATAEQINAEEHLLGMPIAAEYRQLLASWNGIDLDVLRFYGCGQTHPGMGRLFERQIRDRSGSAEGGLVIGSDPAGFVYIQNLDGRILTLDTDGGEIRLSAENLADFLGRLVFGKDAAEFGGPDWEATIRQNGLL